ncbi:MAG: hypothetical protein QNL04_02030 [SAR324 cluster bacterium]|nr:hypothetical protein [SAR324 cluster bacterium]
MNYDSFLYLINIHKGFKVTPLWLAGQMGLDIEPKLKTAIEIIAARLSSRYFPSDFKLNPLNKIPYYFCPEEAQMTEIYLCGSIGPLRMDSFIEQLILKFIYPTSQCQLALFLGRYLPEMEMELAWQITADNLENETLNCFLTFDFIEEKLPSAERMNSQELLTLILSAAANNYLKQVKRLLPIYLAAFKEKNAFSLTDVKEQASPALIELSRYSPIVTAVQGYGDEECISYLIESGFPFDLTKDKELLTSLIERGDTGLLDLFFQSQIIHPSLLPESAYYLAIARGDTKMIQALAQKGIPLDRFKVNSKPLFFALSRNMQATLPTLLQNGANLSNAFYTGFGSVEIGLEDLLYEQEQDTTTFRTFLEGLTSEILDATSGLSRHYLKDEDFLYTALEKHSPLDSESFFPAMECVIWVLETFEKMSKAGIQVSLRIESNFEGLYEKFIIDLNQILYLSLKDHRYQELQQRTFIELSRHPDYNLLSWQKLIPLCLNFDEPKLFRGILERTSHFFRYKDGYYPAREIHSPRLLSRLSSQSPAIYLVIKDRLDLLEPLLDLQSDLQNWQSIYGDSLLSLAMLEDDQELILLLAKKGFSVTAAMKIALGENNLMILDYLLFWLLRKMSKNRQPYFQVLLMNGCDLGEIVALAKNKSNKKALDLIKGWLGLFPENLKLLGPEQKLTDFNFLANSPKATEKLILLEITNPNQQNTELDALEERDYLIEELSLGWNLENNKLTCKDFFTQAIPKPTVIPISRRNREKELLEYIANFKSRVTQNKILQVTGAGGNLYQKVKEYKICPHAGRLLVLFESGLLVLTDLNNDHITPLYKTEEEVNFFFFLEKGKKILFGPKKGKFTILETKEPNKAQYFSPKVTEISKVEAFQNDQRLLFSGAFSLEAWSIQTKPRKLFTINEPDQAHQLISDQNNLVFIDKGLINEPRHRLWHRLSFYSLERGTFAQERPCPREGRLQRPVSLNQPLCFIGENKAYESEAVFYSPKSEEQTKVSLFGAFLKYYAVNQSQKFAFFQQENQGILADLQENKKHLLPIDCRFLKDAAFLHNGQSLVLLFDVDPFALKPGRFVIWDIANEKVIFEETFGISNQTQLFAQSEAIGILVKEHLVKIFDLNLLQYRTSFKSAPIKEKIKFLSPLQLKL